MTATIHDVPQLARLWYAEKSKSAFAQLDGPGWSIEACATYLMSQLEDPDNVIFIERNGKAIIGACGVEFYRTKLPPHFPVVYEWLWFGPKKTAVRVLQCAEEWGKTKGAEWLLYTIHTKGASTVKIHETIVWRSLC